MFFLSQWHLKQNRNNIVRGGVSLAGIEGHGLFWGGGPFCSLTCNTQCLLHLQCHHSLTLRVTIPFTPSLSCFYLSKLKDRHIWFHDHPYLITRKAVLCLINNLSLSFLSNIYNISQIEI